MREPTERPAQLALDVRLRAGPSFANFVPGANALALCAVREVAGSGPGRCFVWGPSGTGKTHLLEAACTVRGEARGRAMYLPLGELAGAGPGVLAGLGRLDLVCLDDLQAVVGLPGWEEALFGLHNAIDEARGSLLVAAHAPPAGLRIALADLASRLAAGAVYQLRPPSDEERAEALRARARELGFALPDEVLRYVLRRCSRDMHALFDLLALLDRSSLSARSRLTVPFVRRLLG